MFFPRVLSILGLLAAAMSLVWLASVPAATHPALAPTRPLPFPDVADARYATPAAKAFFESFFAAKSRHDVAATMRHFSPGVATYTDAVLGWALDGYRPIEALFARYMPQWPAEALSYPTRILGDERSALVMFTDTPELFGDELRILGAVDFEGGRVVRWVDYWDGMSFEGRRYQELRTPSAQFPVTFKEGEVGIRAHSAMVAAASRLQEAFARGDAVAAAALLSNDAVHEDMVLRHQTLGRRAIQRYWEATLAILPYGRGARLRHIVGSERGGGFEWFGAPTTPIAAGITALELDGAGRITRLTTVYDGRQLAGGPRQPAASGAAAG